MNVQLSARESVVVYRDPDTRRILGFGPEDVKPAFPAGTKYTTELCLHARDVERRMMEYRQQCIHDAQSSTLRRLESERPFRQALRDSIESRNRELAHEGAWGQRNIELNNAVLKVMDHFYQRACNARMHAEVCLVAEKHEASLKTPDIALESPAIRRGDVKLA